jgi:hypothetical protein
MPRWATVSVACLALMGVAYAGAGNVRGSKKPTSGGTTATPTPTTTTTTTTPSPTPAAPTAALGGRRLGINVGSASYYSGERDFMNLAMGDNWRLISGGRWGDMDPARIDPATGAVKWLAQGETAALMLTPPPPTDATGVWVRCTFAGTGRISVGGASESRPLLNGVEFRWVVGRPAANVWVSLDQTSPTDPVRALDCREADAPRTALFSPEYLDSLRPFGVVRFLDWQKTNTNAGGKWALRTQPGSITHGATEGVAIEHMIALARELNADPWFMIPWNADEEYVRNFAQLVRDTLPAERKVYVELSNEVWNGSFPVAHQARDEGLAAGLSADPFYSTLMRYSQKSAWMLKIWSQVFAGQPGRLVRVVSTQHANVETAKTVLAFGDTASVVDALATAPYFGHDIRPTATLDQAMLSLSASVDYNIQYSLRNKQIAAQYGKRHIAYESGQHVVTPENPSFTIGVNRDPRMYDLYARYLLGWREQQSDLMVLFNATGPMGGHGAWGLREYSGQSSTETPKRRAALEAAPL